MVDTNDPRPLWAEFRATQDSENLTHRIFEFICTYCETHSYPVYLLRGTQSTYLLMRRAVQSIQTYSQFNLLICDLIIKIANDKCLIFTEPD